MFHNNDISKDGAGSPGVGGCGGLYRRADTWVGPYGENGKAIRIYREMAVPAGGA